MCLAIPAKIVEIDDDRIATTDILGVRREVALDLVPQAQKGDFVLVHAGYGIEVVSEDFARETLDLIREFPELISEAP
jgi:hydrogenase expression/formation protein HypC